MNTDWNSKCSMGIHAVSLFAGVAVLVSAMPVSAAENPGIGLKTAAGPPPVFEKDIRPILAARCFRCHGSKSPKAELDLRTVSSMIRGGNSGPAVIRGYPERSALVEKIAKGEMPPGGKNRLSGEQVALIRRWVHLRTPAREKIVEFDPSTLVSDKDRGHWAYRKLARHRPPRVKARERVRTPIDAYVFHRLEQRGLPLTGEADRWTLARRAWFDLTGLPPSPEDVERFVNDRRPDAWERLIDRLLASPHFGERWGRHWLDAAGYVDVLGTDNDAAIIKQLEGKWRYRDYVVAAYNSDKPFDRFLTEQLAGDELFDWRTAKQFTPQMTEALIATGFLLSAADSTNETELNTPDIRHAVLQQTGQIVSQNVLAMTSQCAKCHDHKYEAIPQHDYYRFLATFAGVFNPEKWVVSNAHGIADVATPIRNAADQHNRRIDEQIQALLTGRKTLPKDAAAKRTEIDGQIARLKAQRRTYGTIQAAYEKFPPSPLFELRRGNHLQPMREVGSGLFTVLSQRPPNGRRTAAVGPSSGRRLELARNLTDPRSVAGALVARVQVNRLWQHLFGRGIVATSDNFGVSGSRPSHPQLLDWLASEFIRRGWQIKPLLKLMMTSAVYRQSSRMTSAHGPAAQRDPSNSLLWRMPLRRLPSEIVRDHLLAVSGRLNGKLGGPPMPLKNLPGGKVVLADVRHDGQRRSLYVLARRNYQLSLLSTFDQPIVATNCTRRTNSAVVTQSLTMLNDEFVLQQAGGFAARVTNVAGDKDTRRQIGRAFQIALGRRPQPDELRLCDDLLQSHTRRFVAAGKSPLAARSAALAELCHTLLNTNEFLYIP